VGQDWNAIRAAFDDWISRVVPSLEDGRHSIRITGVPFEFNITKESDRPAGLFCMQIAPDDATLAGRLEAQITRKAAKLKPYQVTGKRTILLPDSDDIALMNVEKLVDAVRTNFPLGAVEGVDELRYADTSLSSVREFLELGPLISERAV
jgi:hypothetical protein